LEAYWYGYRTGLSGLEDLGATDEKIASFERTHSVNLPDDLRNYLLRLNGIDADPQLFCFWPIEKIIPISPDSFGMDRAIVELDEPHRYFIFADFLIESHYYAIYLGDDANRQYRVILPDFPNQPAIASSFSDFLELYLEDHPRIFGNG
jgi:cell wall assembly regulator SMI1